LDRWSLALCKCTRSRFCGKIHEKPGNSISLPPLIIHREFEASAFTIVLGLSTAISGIACSFGPALLGLVRGLSGGYGAALAVCIALQLAAAAIVLWGREEISPARGTIRAG
jgi:hypothetical protein